MLNFQTWLENPNVVRILLVQAQVESSGVTTTRYLGTTTITVDGQQYLGILKSSFDIQEGISLDYQPSISTGDIEILNNAGERDSWLDDIWVNKSIKVYVGSASTATLTLANDFELIFDGICEDIDSRSANLLNLKLRDKLQKLNVPVTDSLLGNYYQGDIVPTTTSINQYSNNVKPLTFGEVHNITPLLTDSSKLEYMAHNGTVEQIIEVLENGLPVAFTTTGTPAIPNGSFRLYETSPGTITCSVQGDKRTVNIGSSSTAVTYTNTASNILATLLTAYGKTLSYSELDAVSFGSLGTQAVGVYLNDRGNLLQLCQEIAKSCGLCLTVTRTGIVKLINIAIPTSATVNITESDFILNSLRVSQKPPVIGSVKVGYAKNYTTLKGLSTGLPEQHKNLFEQEYLEVLQEDAAIKAKYGLLAEPILETGHLIDLTQATDIALNKLNLYKSPRKVLALTCTSKFLSVQVGTAVKITAQRFGLSAGVFGQVINTKPNWLAGKIDLEVLV